MKFSQTLSSHLTPEWRSQYIDYEGLKAILLLAIETIQAGGFPSDIKRILNGLEAEFFAKCKSNLEKCNHFAAEKLSENYRKHAGLCLLFKDNRELSKKKKKDLSFAFSEQYLNLTLLMNYQSLNLEGFRKILKKHDKIFQNEKGKKWFDDVVMNAPFHNKEEVSRLMLETEEIVINELEDGDRQKAMKRLRVPPLHDITKPTAIFSAGFFIGTSLILLLAGFLGPPIEPKEDFIAHISLFSPMSCIILYLYCLSGNIFGWRAAGVNHILIFEINPRDHLSSFEVLQTASLLSFIYALCFVGFVYHKHINTPRYIFPLLMNCIMVAYLINPIPILHRSTRYWLLTILGRIFIAPFAFVRFADFWIGDQLCSLGGVFTGVVYFICFYINISDWDRADNMMPCSMKVLLGVYILMRILPIWFRFAQCLRRYYNMRDCFSVINAGKYALQLIAAIMSTLFYDNRDKYEKLFDNPYSIPFLLFATISTIYSLVYDFVMDWGLFESVHVFLRSHLVYSPKFIYVLACIENTLIRGIWILFLYLTAIDATEPYILGLIGGFLEIIRFVWNFFRLENEHLNNVGRYRAVRDISVHPVNVETS